MASSEKTIALVDGFDDGHHLTHLRNYAAALLEMGHQVLELLPAPERVKPWFDSCCPALAGRIQFFPSRHERIVSPSWRLRGLYVPLVTWCRVARALREAADGTGLKPDLVFFCWLDEYVVGGSGVVAALLPLVFRRRWSGVYFHPWHLRITGGDTRPESVGAEALLRSRQCSSVAVLDGAVADRLEHSTGKPVVVFPDETEVRLPEEDTPLATEIIRRGERPPDHCLDG